MPKHIIHLNSEVTALMDSLNHPLRQEIDKLRHLILNADHSLTENVKWNGPNYSVNTDDRITMRVQPPKLIQLIFHRGAKKLAQPKDKLINDKSGLLTWKENDRAVATFKSMTDIESAETDLSQIVRDWIHAAHVTS